ncbi:MAG: glucuronate isomerase [Chloroflexota bacterium]
MQWALSPDRFFAPEPTQRGLARQLYQRVADAPIISPHGHVDPRLFADENASFGTPADLLIIPDHYVYRMLYSQGIPLEALGVPFLENKPGGGKAEQFAPTTEHFAPTIDCEPASQQSEANHRKIWQIFAENFYLFRGTPTGIWMAQELIEVFGIRVRLNGETAQQIYDQITEKLEDPAFRPRALFERFNISCLCTTDPAWDRLEYHQAIRASGWRGDIRPTFRPDAVINLDTPGWVNNIFKLSQASGVQIHSYATYIQALEVQRAHFKSLGAAATDHAALMPYTAEISEYEAEAIFQRGLRSALQPGDAERFSSHMLMEMARMSIEDGLVMQLHPGALRDHNNRIFECFGPDKGADIPIPVEYTRPLRLLLQKYGSDTRLHLILFTLDETTYSRELAPLAGHYPAVLLGPPWWFHDSLNGMRRYFEQVIETAGLYNTAGFNDDTRAFASIPARHDVWRRASANWLAGQVVRGVIPEEDAAEMIFDLAVGLAKKAYRLAEESTPL